jgi:hypothetical protein
MKKYTSLVLIFIFWVKLFSQQQIPSFNTNHPLSTIINSAPNTKARQDYNRSSLKHQIDSKLKNFSSVTLPVIFQIVETKDQFNPISPKVISDQIEMLNEAFSGIYDPQKKDSGIRFCKATYSGAIEGSVKISLKEQLTLSNLPSLISKAGQIKAIQPANFINIWIIPLDTNVVGVGIPPWIDDLEHGIIINASYFLEKSSLEKYGKKSLAHLMGSYLGLKPLWGDGGCTDDGILDTPIHNAPNTRCYFFGHLSTCGQILYKLTNNFMDALPDVCAQSFTLGQIIAMRIMLSSDGMLFSLTDNTNTCR